MIFSDGVILVASRTLFGSAQAGRAGKGAPHRHHMPLEFHLSKPKFTLTKFGIQLMVSQDLKNNSQVTLMLLLRLGVDDDVINEDHDELI